MDLSGTRLNGDASCLVDTNILLRIARRSDPQHRAVDSALARLAGQGTLLHYTLQNIAELWNVITRPVTNNGLGLSPAETDRVVRAIEAGMILLADSALVYQGGSWPPLCISPNALLLTAGCQSCRFREPGVTIICIRFSPSC